MDTNGLTLAASNWDAQRSFIGNNFSFRPYFRNALQGETGVFFGLGNTSFKRGYYFGSAVYANGVVIRGDCGEVDLDLV